MKNKTQHNPTMMIKSSFSNKIHKLLGKCGGIKPRTKEWYDCKRQHNQTPWSNFLKLTDQEKIELFDKIEKIYVETSIELGNYFNDRNFKKRVQKDRVKRGYEPKQKTTKEEYEKNLQESLDNK
jgi:hypothetical protein